MARKISELGADEAYLNTVERMEPDITPVDLAGAAASIAISLKRIADALEKIADPNASVNQYGEGWSTAIQNSIERGLRGMNTNG